MNHPHILYIATAKRHLKSPVLLDRELVQGLPLPEGSCQFNSCDRSASVYRAWLSPVDTATITIPHINGTRFCAAHGHAMSKKDGLPFISSPEVLQVYHSTVVDMALRWNILKVGDMPNGAVIMGRLGEILIHGGQIHCSVSGQEKVSTPVCCLNAAMDLVGLRPLSPHSATCPAAAT